MENLYTLARAAVYIYEKEKKEEEKSSLMKKPSLDNNNLMNKFNRSAVTWCGVNNYTKRPRDTIRKPRPIMHSPPPPPSSSSNETPREDDPDSILPIKKREILCLVHEKKKKNKKRKMNTDTTLSRKPFEKADPKELPVELKQRIIQKMGGVDFKCVIQKCLEVSDTNKILNRLSIPLTQVLSEDFLTQKRKISQELSCVPSAAEKVKQKSPKRKKSKNITNTTDFCTEADPKDISVELKNRIIQTFDCGDFKCVIQKLIRVSDLSKVLNRLSIPMKRVLSPDFLTEEEKEKVKEKYPNSVRIRGLEVDFVLEHNIERVYHLRLKQWTMTTTLTYNLVNDWYNEVLQDEHIKLKPYDLVQVWSFRLPSNKLCLLLVKIEPKQEIHQ